MKTKTFWGLILMVFFIFVSADAQPKYDMQNICREKLNRGVVAFRNGHQVIVSWRTLTSDKADEAFNVYRNGKKLNSDALKQGGTFFIDEHPLDGDAVYEIRGGGKNGSFKLKANAPKAICLSNWQNLLAEQHLMAKPIAIRPMMPL